VTFLPTLILCFVSCFRVIASDEASPHECMEVIWENLGNEVTPTYLSGMSDRELKVCFFFRLFLSPL
jgi:hypothetical protein